MSRPHRAGRVGTAIALAALVASAVAAPSALAGPSATAVPSSAPAVDLGNLLGLTQAAAVTPPQNDPFYRPPADLSAPAGTVLRSRPVTVSGGYLPVRVKAWQVLYRSTSATFRPNAVSGTVLVPETPWTNGPRPLVSYAVGTHGLGPECAPSYKLRSGTEREYNLFGQALARGWAVVVTDYEGLGTPGPHTYVAGRSLGHAMLDAARAAKRLRAAGLSARGPVGFWGYSEGGFATAWAAQRAAAYAPDLKVVGSAVGAAPADLGALAKLHDGGPASGFILAAAVGLAKAYPQVPFATILNAEGKKAVAAISTMCTEELVPQFAFKRLDGYTTVPDPMALPEWRKVLADIKLGGVAPKSPAMIYHAPADELVLFTEGVELQAAWCARGAKVQFQPAVLGEHVGGAITGAPLAVDYLANRFAGAAAPNTCTARP